PLFFPQKTTENSIDEPLHAFVAEAPCQPNCIIDNLTFGYSIEEVQLVQSRTEYVSDMWSQLFQGMFEVEAENMIQKQQILQSAIDNLCKESVGGLVFTCELFKSVFGPHAAFNSNKGKGGFL